MVEDRIDALEERVAALEGRRREWNLSRPEAPFAEGRFERDASAEPTYPASTSVVSR